MNVANKCFHEKGILRLDVSEFSSFKSISRNWIDWQVNYPAHKSFRGHSPLSLKEGDLKLYEQLTRMAGKLLDELSGLGMTQYFYIDTIVKRAISPANVKRRYKDPTDAMHQDYFLHDLEDTSFSCTCWLLVDARTPNFQRITFMDYDPKVVINELEDGLSESRHSLITGLVEKHGLIEPIASPNDVGNLLVFNGTVLHGGNSSPCYRFSIDFRILSFATKKKMIASLKQRENMEVYSG